MLQTLKNAWNTKELRNKILFTLFILLLYRIGTVIPVPFVEANNFAGSFNGTILAQMDILSGGSLSTATIFALGVSPYINASIIIQLLAVVFPRLGELAKNDKEKMNFITRIVTIVLAIVTAIGYYFLLKNDNMLTNAADPVQNPRMAWFYGIVIIACYCAGASVIMWLGELINKKGIGNGISMILFANIISTLPSFVYQLVSLAIGTYSYSEKAWLYGIISTLFAILVIAALVALFIFVIWVTGSERRIPITYAKRVVGRKMYGGQSTNLPIKVNMSGVMPIIFANSIVAIPSTIITFAGADVTKGVAKFFNDWFNYNTIPYLVVFFALLIAFAYFYVAISFNPIEVANNIKQNGGSILGIRPGRPTVDYITKILYRITLVGALFVAIIAVLPMLAVVVEHLVSPNTQYFAAFAFGGSSLMIVVGVILETVRDLEAQLTLRNYKGFLD